MQDMPMTHCCDFMSCVRSLSIHIAMTHKSRPTFCMRHSMPHCEEIDTYITEKDFLCFATIFSRTPYRTVK